MDEYDYQRVGFLIKCCAGQTPGAYCKSCFYMIFPGYAIFLHGFFGGIARIHIERNKIQAANAHQSIYNS